MKLPQLITRPQTVQLILSIGCMNSSCQTFFISVWANLKNPLQRHVSQICLYIIWFSGLLRWRSFGLWMSQNGRRLSGHLAGCRGRDPGQVIQSLREEIRKSREGVCIGHKKKELWLRPWKRTMGWKCYTSQVGTSSLITDIDGCTFSLHRPVDVEYSASVREYSPPSISLIRNSRAR